MMRTNVMFKSVAITLALLCGMAASAKSKTNYDELKVPNYILPELFTCNDGTKVTTAQEWESRRRPEIMEFFSKSVYGQTPEGELKVKYKVVAKNRKALDGKATMQQVMFKFSNGKMIQRALALVYYPNSRKKTGAPVFIGYNFKGNHGTSNDTKILYSPYFDTISNRKSELLQRGVQSERWPMEQIIDRGYAAVTMCYHDIYPDREDGAAQSLIRLLPTTKDEGSRWQAIGVWAYGLSSIADWVERQPWANGEQMCVIGHSRQGKAALWAGVQDERFKVVISNNSGCGGAALSKRVFGESIRFITKRFPHWFCKDFTKYSEREAELPFDQHQLLALVAPRYLYVASASLDRWADPKGEYLSAYHASPLYKLYGMKGLESEQMPKIGEPIMNAVGYHMREGKHNITPYDWGYYLDFCDKVFGYKVVNK